METAELANIILTRLSETQGEITAQWANPEGSHTRHFVVDDFLPAELARAVYEAFPRSADGFFDRQSFREKKKTLTDLSQHPAVLTAVTYAMQDPRVVEEVAKLVGFDQIVPDDTLYAGGLSMMFEGDFLNPHIDNSHDAKRNMYRRLNLLYYVSPDWELEKGGNFELWDPAVKQQKTIVSKFNRLVVMETTRDSWHSVSPVAVDAVRCCVSNYYFSAVSADETEYFHVTSFSGRPGETGRRLLGFFDNQLRNTASKLLGGGRGRKLINRKTTEGE